MHPTGKIKKMKIHVFVPVVALTSLDLWGGGDRDFENQFRPQLTCRLMDTLPGSGPAALSHGLTSTQRLILMQDHDILTLKLHESKLVGFQNR